MRKYYPYFTNNETEPEKGLFLPPPSLLKILLKTLPQKRILFLGLAILVKTLGNENFLSSLIYNPGKSILLPFRPSPSFPSFIHTKTWMHTLLKRNVLFTINFQVIFLMAFYEVTGNKNHHWNSFILHVSTGKMHTQHPCTSVQSEPKEQKDWLNKEAASKVRRRERAGLMWQLCYIHVQHM